MIKLKISIVCFFISVAAFGQQRSWFIPIHSNGQLEIQRLKTDIEGNIYFGGGSGAITYVGDSAFTGNYAGGPKTMLKFNNIGKLSQILRFQTDSLNPFTEYFFDLEIDKEKNLYFMNNSYSQFGIYLNDSVIHTYTDSFLYYHPGGHQHLPKFPPSDYYILKFDSLLNLQKLILSKCAYCGSLEFLLNENFIYVIGDVRYKAIFGSDTVILSDLNPRDVWVKYNLNGDLLDYYISDRVYYTNGFDEGVKVDNSGNILFIAQPLSNYTFMDVPLNYNNFYIVKFTPFSKVNWTYEAPFAEYLHSQIVDNLGNIYVYGEAKNDFTFNNQFIKKGNFLFKLDENGKEVWAKSLANSVISDIVVGGYNQLYLIGGVIDHYDFGVKELSNIGAGGFLAKMNYAGEFEWVTTVLDTNPYLLPWKLASYENEIYIFSPVSSDSITFNGSKYAHMFQGVTGGFIAKFIDQTYVSGIQQSNHSANEMTIFPNPTERQFIIKIHSETSEKFNVFISDITGKKIGEIYSGQIINDIEISSNVNFQPGIYIVTAQSNSWTMTKKIVIK